jgi:hypothetical protein
MRFTLMRMTATIGLVLVAMTACGDSGSDDGGVASLSGDGASGADSEDAEQEALDWARCMRDEGVDIPDPETDEDGNIQRGRIQVGPGSDIQPEEFEAAQEVCGEPPGSEMSPQDEAAMQDAALEFAQCMRDKGYDMPDPDVSNGGMRIQGDSGIDMNDPQVQEDMNECQEAFAGLGPDEER